MHNKRERERERERGREGTEPEELTLYMLRACNAKKYDRCRLSVGRPKVKRPLGRRR
jgi:hypothetical protein